MDRADYKDGRGYRMATVVTGFAIMIVTAFFGVIKSFILFPAFAFFLFFYVLRATGKFNRYFFVFLLATMISELLFLYDFYNFMSYASLASVVSCISLLLLIEPTLMLKQKEFANHNIIELIVGFIGLGFVMGYIAYLVFPFMPDTGLFILSLIAFAVTITVCFIIPSFNSHPDNVALFVIGGAYVAEMAFAFIYKFLSTQLIFLLISIWMGCFVKIVLAIYLTRIDKIKNSIEGKDYI